MKKILAIALASSACFAQAATFNYTFSPAPDLNIFGSFEGTASGDLVSNLSNITLSANFRGEALYGGANVLGFSYSTQAVNWVNGGAVASFSGTQNNFAFIASAYDRPTSPPYTYEVLFSTDSHSVYYFSSYDRYANSGWKLTAATAVPEPETYALLFAGLSLVVTLARRRKVAIAA